MSNKGLGHFNQLVSLQMLHLLSEADQGLGQRNGTSHYVIIAWIREHGAKQIKVNINNQAMGNELETLDLTPKRKTMNLGLLLNLNRS